jgi:plastocyanin
MRRLTILTALIALSVTGVATSAGSSGDGAHKSATAAIAIGDNFFKPAKLRVKPRTTVTWTNGGGSAHTVTQQGGRFDSGNLASGERFSRTFKGLGKFPYLCEIHPTMRATVKVCKKVNGVLVCRKGG